MAIQKLNEANNSMENVNRVVETSKEADIPVDVHMDVGTAAAYADSLSAQEHMENVEEQLNKEAESIVTEDPATPEIKNNNVYTKKLTLDESFNDFSMIDASKDEEDRYIDFDMFDFVYSLFSSETDSLIRPLKALSNTNGKRGRKKASDSSSFMYQGSDDYIDETGEKGAQGVSQISTDIDGNVVLYQDKITDFDKVIELCDEYGFEDEGPTPKKAPWVRWNFSFKVVVPTYADGYPMEVEDYFEQRGIDIADVMPPEFIKGRSKDYKKMNDEVDIDFVFDKFVKKAALSNDPLEGFIKDMFKELDERGVKYDRKSLKTRFLDEFNDDFEDEE